MKNTDFKQTVQIGILLFSMFFGAGNLIFAPYLGAQAGTGTWMAALGFLCTAVVLPIAAVVIIARYEDARDMLSRIHPAFAAIFMALVYLLIGPCVAIPRTASTSFEMFGWLMPASLPFRILYTLLFFGAAYLAASHPGRLKDLLGKYMGPILVGLVLVLTLYGLFFVPAPAAAEPSQLWAASPFLCGFNNGYQTMDILAAYCFGIIILLNIQDAGITEQKAQRSVLFKSAAVAGLLLGTLYVLLALTGMKFSGEMQMETNGALILSSLAHMEFGAFGAVLISLIFLCACFNVCSGLLSCCAEFFSRLLPGLSYQKWLIIFTLAGIAVASCGLDFILAFSAPLLEWICPLAVLLLIYGLTASILQERKKKDAAGE